MSIIERALEKRRDSQVGARGEASREESVKAHDQQANDRADTPGEASRSQPSVQQPGGARKATEQSRVAERPVDVRIDYGNLRHHGIQIPGEERSGLEEEFRLIKRPLLDNAFGRHGVTDGVPGVEKGRLIMVTSAIPGEGKTFSTINLALSIAMEVDRTVLVVDADVARPNIPQTLGFEADRGLMDLLTDPQLSLPDVLLRTDIPDLTVLPAGRPHGRSTELLASQAMTDLLLELHERYPDRLILFDSPPLLSTSEPSVLARKMGQVLLVIEAESTAQTAVTRAAELLEGCDVVLSMLNKATGSWGLGYGGYSGYGYGYGYYGKESRNSAAREADGRVAEDS
ncbi:MAG: XrtA-associated tyrosine autokinase [Halorhodospira sp.]